jgi:hypothetical protein
MTFSQQIGPVYIGASRSFQSRKRGGQIWSNEMKHAIKQLFKPVEMWGEPCAAARSTPRKLDLSHEKFQAEILVMVPQSCQDGKRSILFHSLFVQLFFQNLHIPCLEVNQSRVTGGYRGAFS